MLSKFCSTYVSLQKISTHLASKVDYFTVLNFNKRFFSDQGHAVVFSTKSFACENVKLVLQFSTNDLFILIDNFLKKNKGCLFLNNTAANSLSSNLYIFIVKTINIPAGSKANYKIILKCKFNYIPSNVTKKLRLIFFTVNRFNISRLNFQATWLTLMFIISQFRFFTVAKINKVLSCVIRT